MGPRTKRQGRTPETRLLPAPLRWSGIDSLVMFSFLRQRENRGECSPILERDTAPLAFGCKKTHPGMTKAPNQRREKMVGGLRRCEVGPLREHAAEITIGPFNSPEGRCPKPLEEQSSLLLQAASRYLVGGSPWRPCALWESNPHAQRHWNLNPARLPNSAKCASRHPAPRGGVTV